MTSTDTARDALDRAQQLLDRSTADVVKLDEFLPWLEGAIARVHELGDYYQGAGQTDIATVLAADPEAITPPVANEDAVWEVMADLNDGIMRLLRIVTAELTSGLDGAGC